MCVLTHKISTFVIISLVTGSAEVFNYNRLLSAKLLSEKYSYLLTNSNLFVFSQKSVVSVPVVKLAALLTDEYVNRF